MLQYERYPASSVISGVSCSCWILVSWMQSTSAFWAATNSGKPFFQAARRPLMFHEMSFMRAAPPKCARWRSRGASLCEGRRSLDQFVRAAADGWRNREPHRLGRLEVQDHLEGGRLLHGHLRRLGAFEHAPHVAAGAAVDVGEARAVRDQAARVDELSDFVDGERAMHRREGYDPLALHQHERVVVHQQRTRAALPDSLQRGGELAHVSHAEGLDLDAELRREAPER